MQQIEKMAKFYDIDPYECSASFELHPDPRGKEYGHYLLAKVTYDGKLSPH